MAGHVFITGASGFVGSSVVAELLARGYAISALIRRRSPWIDQRVRTVQGDLLDQDVLARAMDGCTIVIHLVGIIEERPRQGITFHRIHVEGTRSVVQAAEHSGVRRFLHMSALGARPNAASIYHRTKYEAEELVRASSLDWTIFQPSMIHGPRGDFIQMETAWARGKRLPYVFMPYFGRGWLGSGGAGKLQPVFVTDVARGFADALDNPQTVRQTYPLGGSQQLTWPQLHDVVTQTLLGKRRRSIGIPAWYATLLTQIAPATWLPFNRDQVVMSQEDNVCDIQKFQHDFGWTPAPFDDSFRSYAHQL